MIVRNQQYSHVIIDGVDYYRNFSFPFTIQNTLNEQLDTAIIQLVAMRKKEPFKPFSNVQIGLENPLYYIVADDKVTEIIGKKRYNHEITLVEKTKELERIICGAKAFTQPVTKNNINYPIPSRFVATSGESGEIGSDYFNSGKIIYENGWNEWTYSDYVGMAYEGTYKTPVSVGNGIKIHSYNDIYVSGMTIPEPTPSTRVHIFIYKGNGKSDNTNNMVLLKHYSGDRDEGISASYDDIIFTPKESGMYTIQYRTSQGNIGQYYCFNYYIYAVYPYDKKIYSLEQVINELLETSETLRNGETPRYKLGYRSEEQKKLLQSNTLELHFANGRSLWENMREIGRIIHAIPRLEGDIIFFDEFGSNEIAQINGARIGFIDSFNVSDYTAALEANVANLINVDDMGEGTICEPFSDTRPVNKVYGFKSIRAESARIMEGTGFISTTFPIQKIIHCEAKIKIDNQYVNCDITPYIFEKNEYDLLSSYSGGYPYSKTYGLYYTQSSKNIDGLWYRVEDEPIDILNSFRRPAIVNILSSVLNISIRKIPNDYADLMFNITYIPTVNARVRQYRTDYENDFISVLAYNQSANTLSSRAFGENLRGQIAMLGTTSSTMSYLFRRISDLPQAGKLFDNDNYISSVTAQVFPTHVVAQIDLSTGFNELGAYVELNNAIRQFEIPSGEERYTLLEEFCNVSEKPQGREPLLAARALIYNLIDAVFNRAERYKIDAARIHTYDENKKIIAENMYLPVVSYSLGNSIYYGFKFEDNFSAGTQSTNPPKNEKYRLLDYVPYADINYSRASMIDFELISDVYVTNNAELEVAHSLPVIERNVEYRNTVVTTVTYPTPTPIIWHKDSADSGNISYQLHFISDSGFIISNLAHSYLSGKAYDEKPKIYFYDRRINQLTGTKDTVNGVVHSSTLTTHTSNWQTVSPSVTVDVQCNKPYKSWAIIKNGEFLLGKNSDKEIAEIYFNFQRKR